MLSIKKKKKKNVEISIDLHYFGVAETENLHAEWVNFALNSMH